MDPAKRLDFHQTTSPGWWSFSIERALKDTNQSAPHDILLRMRR